MRRDQHLAVTMMLWPGRQIVLHLEGAGEPDLLAKWPAVQHNCTAHSRFRCFASVCLCCYLLLRLRRTLVVALHAEVD